MWSRCFLNWLALWLFVFVTTSLCASKLTVGCGINVLITGRRLFRKRACLSRRLVED